MVYKNAHQAFLFEAIVGLLSLLLFVTLGKLGFVALAFIAFRPFLLETSPAIPDQVTYRTYYHAMRLSVFFAGGAILLTIIAFRFEPFESYDKTLVITLIIPWFLLAHGFIGYILSKPNSPFNPNAS